MDELLLNIEKWLDESPGRSIPLLAKKACLSPSTVRRVLQREQKPNEATAKKLLSVTASPEEFIDILVKIFPDTCDHLSTLSETAKGAARADSMDWYMHDVLSFEIFIATSNQAGFPYDKLVANLGENGKARIDSLLQDPESGLTLKDGRLYRQKLMMNNYETLVDMGSSVRELLKQDMDNRLEAIYFYTSSYTHDEIKTIKDAVKNLMSTIDNINKSREPNKQGKPTLIHLAMASLDGEELSK